MLKQLFADTRHRMEKTVEAIRRELASIRTGRASLGILDHVRVSAYGSELPLQQVGNLAVQDATLITIKPYDRSIIPDIERAILKSDLGLTPMSDGTLIRLPIPPLTEERRKLLAKKVHEIREEGRRSLRNVRHEAREEAELYETEKQITEDDRERAYDEIQKLTDHFGEEIEKVSAAKEKEILEI